MPLPPGLPVEPRRAKVDHGLAALLVVGAAALLISGLLWGAAPDEEEFRFTVLTSWLHVRALAEGDYAFWTSLLGFGLPQPLVANYWFHPLLPLLAVMSPVAWIRLVLVAHTAVGAWGMWRLCRRLEIRPVVAASCTASFLLATPSQHYTLTDFWPSFWMMLTTMPWVVLCAWNVLDAPEARTRSAVQLGLITGFVIATNNPGMVMTYLGLTVAMLAANWRASIARWRPLALAAAIALALAAPNIAHLAGEARYFSPALAASGAPGAFPGSAAWDVFLRPLGGMRDARTVFFGGPFALFCLIACLRGGWQRPELVVALAITLVQMFAEWAPTFGASDRILFRDPIVLYAIPLAGLAAERGLRQRMTRVPTSVLLAAQLVILTAAFVPFLERAWEEQRRGAPHYRGGVGEGPVADALVRSMSTPGRVLLSPQVDHQVRERGLVDAGLGINALAYRGVPIVNGWFKAASADPISPDERMFYARIRPPQPLLESGATLDVLGIRYVLASRDEAVAADMRTRGELSTPRLELTFYENDDAWPGAFLIDTDTARAEFVQLEGCEHDRLLCRDLSAVAKGARHAGISVTRRNGAIDVSLAAPDRAPAVLVITEMYRPEWRADAGGARLATAPFASALLAVDVPPGVSSVHLVYRPWPIIAATAIAWLAVIAALAVVVAAKVKGQKSKVKSHKSTVVTSARGERARQAHGDAAQDGEVEG